MTSWGQIPEHLPSCAHGCVIVFGITTNAAFWPVQSLHTRGLLVWPPRCVCFLVSRMKHFPVVSIRVPCMGLCWHGCAALIVTVESKFKAVTFKHLETQAETLQWMCSCGKAHTRAVIRAAVGWSGWRHAVWVWQTQRQPNNGIWLWSSSLQHHSWRYLNRTWSQVSAKVHGSGELQANCAQTGHITAAMKTRTEPSGSTNTHTQNHRQITDSANENKCIFILLDFKTTSKY